MMKPWQLGEEYPGTGCDATGDVGALAAFAMDGSVTHSAMANAAVTLKKGNARGSSYVNSPMMFRWNQFSRPPGWTATRLETPA